MQLPRYVLAKSRVSELQSAANSTITPAEVANLELSKFGAIASAADALSKVAAVEAQARAEEEAADAVIDYESRMTQLDVAQANRQYEVDENNNIILDDQKMLDEESKLRKQAQSEILESVSSRLARRNLDKYFAESNVRRNQAYQMNAVDRRIKVMGSQAENSVNKLILAGDYDGATARARLAAQNGAIGQDKLNVMIDTINEKRTTTTIDNALMGETDVGELTTLLQVLDEDKFPGGAPTNISSEQRYMYTNRINAKLADLDNQANAEVEAALEEQYLKLLVPTVNGQIPLDELRTYRNTLDKGRFDKLVGFAIAASDKPTKSDSAILETYERRALALRVGKGFDPAYSGYQDTVDDMIEAITMDSDIAIDDANRIITNLEGYVDAIRKDPDLEDILNVELSKITGRKVDQFMVQFEGQDRSHITVGERLQRDFKRAMLQAGPKNMVFNGEEWMRENVGKYQAQVQTEMLKRYQIPEAPMINGKVDADKLGAMMLEYQKKTVGTVRPDGESVTEEDARLQAEFDYQTFMRLIEAG